MVGNIFFSFCLWNCLNTQALLTGFKLGTIGPFSSTKDRRNIQKLSDSRYRQSLKIVNPAVDVLYEDEHLISISKPSGMVTMPCESASHGTAVHAVVSHISTTNVCNLPVQDLEIQMATLLSCGVVHRLDKEVSGALVIAKTKAASKTLSKLFSSRSTEKTYVAIVQGRFNNTSPNNSFLIDLPLFRRSSGKAGVAVSPLELQKSKSAATKVTVLATNNSFSLLEVQIDTGRFHQIRCHLAYLNCPIVGDSEYGRRPPAKTRGVPHTMLHSYTLKINHPFTKIPLSLRAPLPLYMLKFAKDIIDSSTIPPEKRDELITELKS